MVLSLKSPLLLMSGFLIVANQYLIYDLNAKMGGMHFWQNWNLSFLGSGGAPSGDALSVINGADNADTAKKSIMMQGVPKIYGQELGVNFDSVEASMNIMANLDASIKFSDLTKEHQERYLDIGGKIACEFCCGVKTLIFSNGEAACGCAHSQAMRGLAKYLLQKHSQEYTDSSLLLELTKWKAQYFPQQMVARAASLINAKLPLNATNLNTNNPSATPVETSGKTNLPSMVGGC